MRTQRIDIDTFLVNVDLAQDAHSPVTRREVEFVTSELQLAGGAHILDAPCGNGRHSFLFARRGYRVTGIDVSRESIGVASARHGHRNVKYRATDICTINDGTFDAIVSLFSCIGYNLSQSADERVLDCLARVLRSGGGIVLSTANHGFLCSRRDISVVGQQGHFVMHRIDEYDSARQVLSRRIVIVDQKAGRHYESLQRRRIYARRQMMTLLQRAGIQRIRCFADYIGGRFIENESPHAIYVGTKA